MRTIKNVGIGIALALVFNTLLALAPKVFITQAQAYNAIVTHYNR